MDLLIRNAEVLQVEADGAQLLGGRDIIISGKRIAAIEPSGTSDASQAASVLDAGG